MDLSEANVEFVYILPDRCGQVQNLEKWAKSWDFGKGTTFVRVGEQDGCPCVQGAIKRNIG
jgi:hypothetical protein